MDSRKNLQFKSYGVKKPICKLVRAHREPFSRSFGTNETQQLREGQLVGRMLLSTGATGVKQARYRQGTRGQRGHSYAHAQYTLRVLGTCSVAVQCETWHGVMPASSACMPRVLHFSASLLGVCNDICHRSL